MGYSNCKTASDSCWIHSQVELHAYFCLADEEFHYFTATPYKADECCYLLCMSRLNDVIMHTFTPFEFHSSCHAKRDGVYNNILWFCGALDSD